MFSETVVWFWLACELVAYAWPFIRDVLTLVLLWRMPRNVARWIRRWD